MPSRRKPAAPWEFRPLAELTLDPRNARTHSDEQIAQIAASIETFGWTMPIAADEVIRAGNGRYRAAQMLYAEGRKIFMLPGAMPAGSKSRADQCR